MKILNKVVIFSSKKKRIPGVRNNRLLFSPTQVSWSDDKRVKSFWNERNSGNYGVCVCVLVSLYSVVLTLSPH